MIYVEILIYGYFQYRIIQREFFIFLFSLVVFKKSLFSSQVWHPNKCAIFWSLSLFPKAHNYYSKSVFIHLLNVSPDLNVSGNKISCLQKLSQNLLHPTVLSCRYMINTHKLPQIFYPKVLLNTKFQVASPSASFLYRTQSSSVLNFLNALSLHVISKQKIPVASNKSTISALALPSFLLFPLNPLPPTLKSSL